MDFRFLLFCAVLPVILLCYYIYKKDRNKEPVSLLMKLFFLGFFSAIPVVIIELVLDYMFSIEGSQSFLVIFIYTFFTVSLVEEGFKWIITKNIGYRNKEFDEVYDIIVYSVFVSLGFACIENILYVLSNGFMNAVMRGLLSIPGHACYAVVMGYFLAQAKLSSSHKKKATTNYYLILSILCPSIVHTLYDALILYSAEIESFLGIIVFLLFDIIMVVVCFLTVNKISKKESHVSNHKDTLTMNHQNTPPSDIHYCPVCGKGVSNANYCMNCGCKLR